MRGSKSFYRALSGAAAWDDGEADAAITTPGFTKVTLDSVTLYKVSAGFSQTKYWDGSAWQTVAQVVDGNLIVHGTVGTDQLVAGISISAPIITGGAINGGTITGAALIINSSLGLRYANDNGVYTITGASGNGVQYGAQIDLAGNGSGGGRSGALVLQAGDHGDGHIYLRTGYGGTVGGSDYGVDRMIIRHGGAVEIAGALQVGGDIAVDGNRVLDGRQAAVAAADTGADTSHSSGSLSGSDTVSAGNIADALNALAGAINTNGSRINDLIARLRVTGGHGLIWD